MPEILFESGQFRDSALLLSQSEPNLNKLSLIFQNIRYLKIGPFEKSHASGNGFEDDII